MKVEILHLLYSLQLLFFVIGSNKAINLPCPNLFYWLECCGKLQHPGWDFNPGLKWECFGDSYQGCYHFCLDRQALPCR